MKRRYSPCKRCDGSGVEPHEPGIVDVTVWALADLIDYARRRLF